MPKIVFIGLEDSVDFEFSGITMIYLLLAAFFKVEIDLSYFYLVFQPIGALNPARLSHLQERFDSWEEDRVPPFFYGTHYSTMAFVLHWLVRVVRVATDFFLLLHI